MENLDLAIIDIVDISIEDINIPPVKCIFMGEIIIVFHQ